MAKRTVTIKIDEPLYRRLLAEAERRRTTRSNVLREALESCLSEREVSEGSLLDKMRDLLGKGEGPGDLSTNKKYLEGYGE